MVETQYRFWFDLDNPLTRWRKNFFLISQKFAISEIRKIPYGNPTFSWARSTKFFICFTLSLHWWYFIPRLVSFGQLPNPMKKNLFLKFLFREIQKVLYEKPIFLLSKLNQKYFLLYSLFTLLILHTAFGLNWTTPWPAEKKLKFAIREIRKIPYENPTFS